MSRLTGRPENSISRAVAGRAVTRDCIRPSATANVSNPRAAERRCAQQRTWRTMREPSIVCLMPACRPSIAWDPIWIVAGLTPETDAILLVSDGEVRHHLHRSLCEFRHRQGHSCDNSPSVALIPQLRLRASCGFWPAVVGRHTCQVETASDITVSPRRRNRIVPLACAFYANRAAGRTVCP